MNVNRLWARVPRRGKMVLGWPDKELEVSNMGLACRRAVDSLPDWRRSFAFRLGLPDKLSDRCRDSAIRNIGSEAFQHSRQISADCKSSDGCHPAGELPPFPG